MNLLQFLFRTCRDMLIFTGLAALLSGACNAALIALVNAALNHSKFAAGWLAGGFAALMLGKLVTNLGSQVLLAHYAQGAIGDLRRELARKILSAPLRQLEEIGGPSILAALTDDVFNITQALLGMPIIAVNAAILLGGAAYLGWLSWRVLAGLMVLIFLGALSHRMLMRSAFRFLRLAREEEDKLYHDFRALTEGIKELKLHRSRREAFLRERVGRGTEAFQKCNVAAEYRFALAQNWNHFLFYLLMGLVLFLMPAWQGVSTPTLTGYVITMLYLMGPLAGVMSSFALFGRASVALQKVEALGISLSAGAVEKDSTPRAGKELSFKRLELIRVRHSYRHEKDDSNFVLGPMSLDFSRGELVFLVGGNGSGKSTLAKIVAGLYVPEGGEIRWDGALIGDHNRDEYRQLFSALFSDFYLFDTLLGLHEPNLDARARKYLAQFHLDHKVRVEQGNLSTTLLSQGQRKRLALLTAYLEDRPFYLFDEWASDQDPQFKAVFYTQLLPELKARNKTVLVITHDDRYFHLADRLIKLDYGQIDASTPLNGEILDPPLRV